MARNVFRKREETRQIGGRHDAPPSGRLLWIKGSSLLHGEHRNLDDSLKARPRIQAAVHGRSMEDEARDILRASLSQEPEEPKNLGTAINALFKPLGGFDLPEVPREPIREPPTFDE